MKQNITLLLDQQPLKKARAFRRPAENRHKGMLWDELRRLIAEEAMYEQAKAMALAQLSSPFRLGGAKIADREALHDRQGLR